VKRFPTLYNGAFTYDVQDLGGSLEKGGGGSVEHA